MNKLDYQQKALRLLEVVSQLTEDGDNSIAYVAYVLESFYDDGYHDALHKLKPMHTNIFGLKDQTAEG